MALPERFLENEPPRHLQSVPKKMPPLERERPLANGSEEWFHREYTNIMMEPETVRLFQLSRLAVKLNDKPLPFRLRFRATHPGV